MAHPANIIEIPELIPKRVMKKIIFTDTEVSIKKPLSFGPDVFIPSESISAFRFGIEDMQVFKLTFCRQYFIEIKNYQNQIFRIKLSSYYGINRKAFYVVWAELLERFWNFYMANQLNCYTELFHLHQTFELSGVTFHADGISWGRDNKLKWNEIAVSSYQTHFIIHHINDLSQCKYCVFAIHWNAVVLQSLLNDIIKQPKEARKSSSL